MDQRYGLYSSPNGYYGWGTNAPIGEMVDAFEMADGTAFSWSNAAHAQAPYAKRDPRFYATILYNGAKWRERPQDVKGIDPHNIIQTGVWKRWNATTNTAYDQYGVDTRNSPIENWNGSYTGYYCRKYVDPGVNVQYVRQPVTWRYMRYAEVLLNFAEASNEYEGPTQKVYDAVELVRRRAGLSPYELPEGLTKEQMREAIRAERRIELAFEGHRFWDVRRWKIAEQTETTDDRHGGQAQRQQCYLYRFSRAQAQFPESHVSVGHSAK